MADYNLKIKTNEPPVQQSQNLPFHIMSLQKKLAIFQTAMVSCPRFSWINSSDHRRVWTVNFLQSSHVTHLAIRSNSWSMLRHFSFEPSFKQKVKNSDTLNLPDYLGFSFWQSGLDNFFVCKRFVVQNLMWSLGFVTQIILKHDIIPYWKLTQSSRILPQISCSLQW